MKKEKAVYKDDLDKLIRLTRKYWQTGDTDILDGIGYVRDVIAESTGTSFLAFTDLLNSLLESGGLSPNASNETIYAVLNTLGVGCMREG